MSYFTKVKSFLVQVASGVLASAIFALFTIQDEQLHMSTLALGIISIPIFLALASLASGFYFVYIIIRIVDVILTKLNFFNSFDDLS